jgi:hypothetical protein
MARRGKEQTPHPMNTWIVIGALYVLGYINPDTRDAFMWAGLIVAGLIACVGLVWMVGRLLSAKKRPAAVESRKAVLIGAEQRFERRVVEVAEAESDTIGI